MQHIIKKQTIQLLLHRKLDAFRMQQLVSEHYWQDVVPVLEKLFDEMSSEDETMHIDKLSIDLGVLSEKEISRQTWNHELLSVITKQLREKLREGKSVSGGSVQIQKKAISMGQQWLFYMQNGYLPWNTLQVHDTWKQQVLEALAIDYASISSLRKLIQTNPDAVSRMVQQHTEAFLVQLMEILTARRQPKLLSLLKELALLWHALQKSETESRPPQRNEIKKRLWEQVLKLAAVHERKADTRLIVQSMLEKFIGTPASLQSLKPEISSKLPVLWPIIQTQARKAVTADKKGFMEKEVVEQAQSDDTLTEKEKPIDEEGIFVQHAGLVLLHPFLNTFFRRLQLVAEGRFADEIAQQKALYLLHYLSTGDDQAEEYALVMPKALCAYPLQKAVARHLYLSREEKEEAEHLLTEAIRQWEVLKSTSSAGLREGFLQRSGKLFTKYDNLYLQVEANAIDILLDQLPWNLSLIKLPWMKDMLRVEWR